MSILMKLNYQIHELCGGNLRIRKRQSCHQSIDQKYLIDRSEAPISPGKEKVSEDATG